jgi:hypothetical protein
MYKGNTDELEAKFKDRIGDPFRFRGIINVNHRPHPFTVGARHVWYAAEHCGGILGDEAIRAHPCAVRGCRLPVDEHTWETVMFLQSTRNATSEEAREALLPLTDEMEALGIDGFAFVETPEGYRIGK